MYKFAVAFFIGKNHQGICEAFGRLNAICSGELYTEIQCTFFEQKHVEISMGIT